MRFHLTPIFISLLLIGCNSEPEKNEESTSDGTVMQSEILDTCFCGDLDIDSNGIHYMMEERYTGMCIDYYPETDLKYIEKSILDGKLHGKSTFYDKTGEVLAQEVYEGGDKKRSGEVDVLNCDCSELEKVVNNSTGGKARYFLDGIPYTGKCQKYYPESAQIYMDISYKDGLLDGTSSYYNRDGSAMYFEKYSLGVLITTLH